MKMILVESFAIGYMQMKLARILNLQIQEIIHCPVESAVNENLTDPRAKKDGKIGQK